jgi:hypothetical protein
MKLSLKILESNAQINKLVLEALVPEIANYMSASIKKLRTNIPKIISETIKNSPEYDSIMSGQLKYELGIPDPQTKLAGIIEIWTNNIYTEYHKPTISAGKIKTSFSMSLIRSDFADVLSSDFSIVVDAARGYNLQWLEWLLLDGNKVIVPKHEVIFRNSRFSRTGAALMKESTQSWRVPSQFSGTITDNWITRAIDSAQTKISDTIEKAFN